MVVADLAPECTLEAQPNLLYRQCDVTQEDQVKAAMEAAVTAFDSLTVVVITQAPSRTTTLYKTSPLTTF